MFRVLASNQPSIRKDRTQKRVMERIDAFLSETDDRGRMPRRDGCFDIAGSMGRRGPPPLGDALSCVTMRPHRGHGPLCVQPPDRPGELRS